jgi:alpha-galactosidase
MLARWIGAPYAEVNYVCGGINHQAFFLQFRHGKDDLYPQIWEAIQRPEVHGEEPVRVEIMRHFGYFVTESSGHASEYMPYFRKSPQMIEQELVPMFTDDANDWLDWGRTGGYLRHCLHRLETFQSEYEEILTTPPAAKRSHEYGSWIIEAVETNQPVKINGNVPNVGLIDNLPAGCCVEVPCLVDASGIQPTPIRNYPPQLAALNRTNINVQSLIVEAALAGNTEAVHHAVLLDPLTAAVCTMAQIHSMTDELLAAQAQWLPQFS